MGLPDGLAMLLLLPVVSLAICAAVVCSLQWHRLN